MSDEPVSNGPDGEIRRNTRGQFVKGSAGLGEPVTIVDGGDEETDPKGPGAPVSNTGPDRSWRPRDGRSRLRLAMGLR